jgi:Flp pilus assembly protein TadD
VAAAFQPVLDLAFVNVDDDVYVTANPQVAGGISPAGLTWALSTFHQSNWHPLTWISHQVDVSLWGLSPRGHHLTSLLLHLAVASLLHLFLRAATGRGGASLLAAALFAVHPLRVEVVAWVAERKELMAMIFSLLALTAYLRHVRLPSARRLLPVALLFAAALTGKPMAVTLPILLLVLDWWPLGRFGQGGRVGPGGAAALVAEKAPLLLLSGASATVTWLAQSRGGSVASLADIPLHHRLVNALLSPVTYLRQTVWPEGLAVFYPHQAGTAPPGKILAAVVLLAAVTVAAISLRRWRPWLAASWAWYAVSLTPVLGVVQVGLQAHADRYTYLPLAGITLAVAWEWSRLRPGGWASLATGGAVILLLVLLSRRQTGVWRDSGTLFRHALQVTRGNWFAHHNLGLHLAAGGDWRGAGDHFRQAVELHGRAARLWYNLGLAQARTGESGAAATSLGRALALEPGLPEAHYNLGLLSAAEGRWEAAAGSFRRAVDLRPTYQDAWANLGASLHGLGRYPEAAAAYRSLLLLAPDDQEAREGLAASLAGGGR